MSYVHMAKDVWYQLKGGVGSEIDNYIISIDLDIDDLNEIKKLVELATEPDNSYITFGSDLVKDMNGNEVQELINGQAIRVSCFTEDVIRPQLDDFHLDMNEGNCS